MREEIIQKAFESIDRLLRPAAIARIGGFGPTNRHTSSWFGGGFVGKAGEAWPEFDGEPAVPLLQVRCDELPVIPDQLKNVALLNVFFTAKTPPPDHQAANGDRWLIRTYDSLVDLESLKPPGGSSSVHAMPVRWKLSKQDAPGWDDACAAGTLSEFVKLPDAVDLFFGRYASNLFTKVDGWPSYIQSATGDADAFVLQIASEEKPRWILGNAGNIYIFRKDGGDWEMRWDSY